MEKPKLETLKNNIPEQRLTYANQLTVRNWNDIINILARQTNVLADSLQKLNKFLLEDGAFIDTVQANIGDTNNVSETISNLIDTKLEQRIGNLESILDQVTTEINDKNKVDIEAPVLYLDGPTITANLPSGADEIKLEVSSNDVNYSAITPVLNSSVTSINLDTYVTIAGTYYIRGYAHNITNGKRSVNSIPVTYIKASISPSLSKPTDLSYDSDSQTFAWTAVSNAESYTIYNGDDVLYPTIAYGTSIVLHLPAGTYSLSVVAKATGYMDSAKSDALSITLIESTLPTYTVTFNANGSNGTVPTQLIVEEGTQLSLDAYSSPSLVKTGYNFSGWGTSANATIPVTGLLIAQNIVLYAIWTLKPKMATVTGLTLYGTAINWNDMPTGTYTNLEYKVYYKKALDSSYQLLGNTKVKPYSLTSAANMYMRDDGTYNLIVIATDPGYLDSDPCTPIDYVVAMPKAEAPNLNFIAATSMIEWSPITTEVNGTTYTADYAVYIGNSIIDYLPSSATSYNLSGKFSASGTYTVGIKAQGIAGLIKDSDIATVSVTYVAPVEPYNVVVVKDDSDTTFPIEVVFAPDTYVLTNVANTFSFSDTDVPIRIIFRGRTANQAETLTSHTITISCTGSDYDYDGPTTITTYHDEDVIVTIYVSGATSITLTNEGGNDLLTTPTLAFGSNNLTWDDITDATKYILEWSYNSEPYLELETINVSDLETDPKFNVSDIVGSLDNGTYVFRVRAVQEGSETNVSLNSNTVTLNVSSHEVV